MDNIWQLQDAKSRFSELVDRTLKDGPQIVTRHGHKTVVILPYEDYDRMTRGGDNLAAFLLESPLSGLELDVERDSSLPRDVDIE